MPQRDNLKGLDKNYNRDVRGLAICKGEFVGNKAKVLVSGDMKCSFFGKFGVFCFFVTSVFPFALLPYYLRII